MPQTCSICRNPSREAIDKALIAGEPYRHVAARYDTSTGALQRHKPHISEALIRAREQREMEHGEGLLSQVQDLVTEARAILEKAEDQKTALAAIRELRGTLELLGKITGELQASTQTADLRPMFILPGTIVNMGITPPETAIDVTPEADRARLGEGKESDEG